MTTIKHTRLTAAPLYPWLRENCVTDKQMEAIQDALYIDAGSGPMADGAMILLPVAAVHDALPAIDDWPWKDTSPREFREYLQAELAKTGIDYWYTGAITLEVK